MQQFTEAERRVIQMRDLSTVKNGLPPLITVPPPSSVVESDWYRGAELGKVLTVMAFLGAAIPSFSAKVFAAIGWLQKAMREGKLENNPMLLGSSSGNFIKDLALASQGYAVRGVNGMVNYGTLEGKLKHARAAGASIEIAPQGVPATDCVSELAERRGWLLADQYTDEGVIEGQLYLQRHIEHELRRLGENAGCNVGAVTGTCATLCGVRRYLVPSGIGPVKIMGVASMSKQEKVPGSRSRADLAELRRIGGFFHRPEWKNLLDFPLVENIPRAKVFTRNVELARPCRIPVGPTGALLECGFYGLLQDYVEKGKIEDLMNDRGKIVACLIFMDSYLPYLEDPEFMSYFTR